MRWNVNEWGNARNLWSDQYAKNVNMTSKITLSGMTFYGYHGCTKEESIMGGYFIVDVSFSCDTSQAVRTDDVRDAVDYPQVYLSIKKVMKQPKHLLETLAAEIIEQIKSDFPTVFDIHVKVSKPHPPLPGQVDMVSMEMEEA